MTITPTPQQLLREAAAKIETALVLLNAKEHKCSECGSRHAADNRVHWFAYNAFTNTPSKLREHADAIDDDARAYTPTASPRG